MTELENFRATVEHRTPGRILAHAHFTPDLLRRLQEHFGAQDVWTPFGMYQQAGIGGQRKADAPKLDFSKYWQNEKLPDGAFINGLGVAEVPSGFYHFTGYVSPLRNATSLRELEEYPMELAEWSDFSGCKQAVEDAHAKGLPTTAWVGHMYENAWQIRGYEPFLMDMIDQPAWAECLLERQMEQNMVRAVAFAKAGVDTITTGDDVASQKALMFAPDMWREFMLSRWAKVWRAIKEINPRCMIWYHSDGDIISIIGDLIDAGVDILNPLQPECLDIPQVHRRWGNRVTFDGCVGTQSVMPWGTPQDVKNTVRGLIDNYGRHGGLIVSPTHILEPEVPIANIAAMFEACREYKL